MNRRLQLAEIVEGASNLFQCLADGTTEGARPRGSEDQEALLETWCECVAGGDTRKFARRLEWSGKEIQQVMQALGRTFRTDVQSLPEWAKTFRELLDYAESVQDRDVPPQTAKNAVPFREALAPFVEWAGRNLQDQLAPFQPLVSDASTKPLESLLLEELSRCCGPALCFEFYLFRSIQSERFENTHATTDRKKYLEFVAMLLSGGLWAFFLRYPVLGRLVATKVDHWVERILLFAVRLNCDLAEISQVFNRGVKLAEVHSIREPPAGEGVVRSPLIVKFDNGLQIVYRAREVRVDRAWAELQTWINRRHPEQPFQPISVLPRDGYGWVEFVPYEPCQDQTSLETFYRVSGMTLCLFYLLSGTDMHQENLIVSRGRPHLVDLETLLRSELAPEALPQTEHRPFSVLSTGMLPQWVSLGVNGAPVDMSGLGCLSEQVLDYLQPEYSFANTDHMRLKLAPRKIRPELNIPFAEGLDCTSADFKVQILAGFDEIYRILLQHRRELLSERGPLAGFRDCTVRFLPRRCEEYGRLMELLVQPQSLRSGLEFSMEIDRISRRWLRGRKRPTFWPILDLERRSLEDLELPRFTCASDSVDLTLPDGTLIKSCFRRSGFARVTNRCVALSEEDLELQTSLIREAYDTRFAAAELTGVSETLQSTETPD